MVPRGRGPPVMYIVSCQCYLSRTRRDRAPNTHLLLSGFASKDTAGCRSPHALACSIRPLAVCSLGSLLCPQGGAVVDALLARGRRFRVRAVTRNAEGPAAKALAARGVEVVKGDLGDREGLAKIFLGAEGLFVVTQPWSADFKVAPLTNLGVYSSPARLVK